MDTPNVNCNIEIYCAIYPSEDAYKVKQSLLNIFPNVSIQETSESLKGASKNVTSLEKVQKVIHSRQSQKTLRRLVNKNLMDNSTWFYLNKQAAFVGSVALCDEAEESPLGPIKIVIQSNSIEKIIDWLTS